MSTVNSDLSTTSIDWTLLAASDQGSDSFSDTDVAVARRHALDAISENIELLRDVLVSSAKQKASEFWEMHKEGRELYNKTPKGFFGTRARRKDNTIMLVWYHNRMMQTKDGKQPRSAELSKGKGFRYRPSTFNRAADWEREIIDYVEDSYSEIREQWASVTKLASALSGFEKALSKQEAVRSEQKYKANDSDEVDSFDEVSKNNEFEGNSEVDDAII